MFNLDVLIIGIGMVYILNEMLQVEDFDPILIYPEQVEKSNRCTLRGHASGSMAGKELKRLGKDVIA